MKTASETPSIPPLSAAKLPQAAGKPSGLVFDRAEARKAAEETDRIREENRRKFGVQEVGVEIIREFRGPLPG